MHLDVRLYRGYVKYFRVTGCQKGVRNGVGVTPPGVWSQQARQVEGGSSNRWSGRGGGLWVDGGAAALGPRAPRGGRSKPGRVRPRPMRRRLQSCRGKGVEGRFGQNRARHQTYAGMACKCGVPVRRLPRSVQWPKLQTGRLDIYTYTRYAGCGERIARRLLQRPVEDGVLAQRE